MILEYSPKERLNKIVEILAEGVISFINSGVNVFAISYLHIRKLKKSFQIKPEDIIVSAGPCGRIYNETGGI